MPCGHTEPVMFVMQTLGGGVGFSDSALERLAAADSLLMFNSKFYTLGLYTVPPGATSFSQPLAEQVSTNGKHCFVLTHWAII